MSNETNLQPESQRRRPFWFSMWENLTYPQKFTSIALIFVLSLFAFLPLALDQNTRIENYGRKEEQGTLYLRFLWQFSIDLQALHVASIEREDGIGSDDAVSQAVITVDADLLALETASQQYGVPLGMNPNIQEIQTKWNTLRNAVGNRQVKDIEAGFITLNNSIASLVTEIGNQSYLILDPDLDTYYLMDTVLLNMPENNELIFQIWQISHEASETGELSNEKQSELGTLVGRLQENIRRLDQNLQTSFANNKNGEFEPRVSLSLQNYLAAAQSFINLNNTYLANTQNFQLSPLVLKASYSGVRDATQVFYTASSETLQKGVQNRIQSLSLRLYTAIMLAALSTLIAFIIGLRIMRTISNPLVDLLNATQKLTAGDMSTRISNISRDEAGQVAQAFNVLAEEVQNSRVSLQSRADELERRTNELEAIAETARDISIIHDLNTMLNVATSVIRERFNFYHTAIFLIDERSEYAILRAANGQSAQELLDQNYKVRVGAQGVVGNVIQTGQAQIASPSEYSPSLKNPLLQESKSEIGLPLRGKSLTIGVLNIHSKQEKAFSRREIQIFQILADQLSSAIDNAQLVEQIEATIAELNAANRAQTKFNWETKSKQEKLAYEYDGLRVQPIPQNLPSELLNQLESGKAIILEQNGNSNASTLMVPLIVSGQVIGVIGMEREKAYWSNEEISIAEAAANRTAITLENARLLEESQRRALKERAISEATSRISAALSVENILGITAEELERVIGDSGVILQINPDSKSTYDQ